MADLIIIPFPDFTSPANAVGILGAGAVLGGINLNRADIPLDENLSEERMVSFLSGAGVALHTVQQLEHDKGNVLTAHRVDGGYALTQRGGNQDDMIFMRILLTGPNRFLTKEILAILAGNKSIPLMILSKEVIFLKRRTRTE